MLFVVVVCYFVLFCLLLLLLLRTRHFRLHIITHFHTTSLQVLLLCFSCLYNDCVILVWFISSHPKFIIRCYSLGIHSSEYPQSPRDNTAVDRTLLFSFPDHTQLLNSTNGQMIIVFSNVLRYDIVL